MDKQRILDSIKKKLEDLSLKKARDIYYIIDYYADDYDKNSLHALIYQWEKLDFGSFGKKFPLTLKLASELKTINDGIERPREVYEDIISLAKKALEEIEFGKIIHKMNLQPKYFNFIKNGTKRIELRLYDKKRQTIQLGDTIKFSNSENDSLEAEVVGLLRYQTFDDLFKDFDISILADKSMTKQELLDALSEFYTTEKQAEYGVLGIRLKLTKSSAG